MTRNRRRRFPMVAKYYQTRMLLFVLSYMIIVIMFMAIFVFAPNFIQMADPSVPFNVQAAAAEKILYGHAALWPSLLALVILIGIHYFQVFHRFIGPMYRFSHSFNAIAAGDVSFQIQLREKDYLKNERDEINHMLSILSEQIGGAQKETAMAMMLVQQMAQAGGDLNGRKAISSDRLIELRERLGQLSETLGYFKTEDETKLTGDVEEDEQQTADGNT
ncbi:hypothetical protein D3OALGB2SA_4439 [Olavius algarvensis associated proteobacterium Delta 3]|nr:hypothetical protein D3OALGB2SA_4439 [Olavius algarvensis associated proteobacterium Delta 3]